jgi:uncharacterized protein YbjT (DUF2867 family)
MRVVIAGGHGKVARHLERMLAERGDQPVGIIRNPAQAGDLQATGAEAVVLDLEKASVEDLADVVNGADAVVFAAGAGPNSGAARKETVDKGAAVLLTDAAKKAGVRRYLMVSSMGTDKAHPNSDDVFQVYLRAKKAADEYLQGSGLDWTIVRPGQLNDNPGTGKVTVGTLERGDITRADVAAVLMTALSIPTTVHKAFDVVNGDQEIPEALAALT